MIVFMLVDLGVIILAKLEYLNEENFGFWTYVRITLFVTFILYILFIPRTVETKVKEREFILWIIKFKFLRPEK